MNTTIMNMFNTDNSNITYIKTQHRLIMTTIGYRILKFEPMVKKPVVTNYIYFLMLLFSVGSIPSIILSLSLYSVDKTYFSSVLKILSSR